MNDLAGQVNVSSSRAARVRLIRLGTEGRPSWIHSFLPASMPPCLPRHQIPLTEE